VEGKGRAQAVRLLPLLVDEILPVYAPQIDDSALLERIRRTRTLTDLIRLPIVWREAGSGTRNVVTDALVKAGIGRDELRPRIVLGGTESIKNAVLAGIGVAFLSRCSIEQEVASGRLVPIPLRNFRIERTFRWALPGGGLSGTAALFFSFVQTYINAAEKTITSMP
jgi:DNA-binding transcriptional LysR family regulator